MKKTKKWLVIATLALGLFLTSSLQAQAVTFIDSGQALGNSDSYGVSVGDVDGDGDLDAFVVNQGFGEANKVWLNDGSGVFTDSEQALGNSYSTEISLGDVDGDGDLDAFVANYYGQEGRANKVWLNDGSGVFTDSGLILGNSFSYGVDLGDVDGDGDLDAFVANTSGQGQPNKVWLNDGSGGFSDSGQALGYSTSLGVSLGDVDGDGDLDAFVANNYVRDQGRPNKVWLNDGSGVFTDSGQALGSAYSTGVSLGDVDGDGDLDAFVANYDSQNKNKVWLNDGSGVFTDSGQALGYSTSLGVSLGDVDGDGDLDAFVINRGDQANKVWLNDGSGVFTDSGLALGNSDSSGVSLGDVDGDGDLDAFVVNEYEFPTGGQPNNVYLNTTGEASTSVTPTPDNPTPQQGDTVCVQVDVADVADCYAAIFDVGYDPDVLDYQDTSEGTFLNQDGESTTMQASPLNGNESTGQIVVGISRLGDAGGVSGSGDLATVCFQAIGDYCSTSEIIFGNAYLEGTEQDSDIPAAWNETTITIALAAPANLTTDDPGAHDRIDLNWDGVAGATEYEIYRSDSPGGSYELIGTTTDTSYQDTDCIIPTLDYYYQVRAVSGETCISEFSPEASGMADSLLGDINNDGRVDGRDLSRLARAFGSSDGDPRFDCQADLNRDGLIDGDDLSLLTANFGQTL